MALIESLPGLTFSYVHKEHDHFNDHPLWYGVVILSIDREKHHLEDSLHNKYTVEEGVDITSVLSVGSKLIEFYAWDHDEAILYHVPGLSVHHRRTFIFSREPTPDDQSRSDAILMEYKD